MISKEIWNEIQKLTVIEKLRLIEELVRSLREDLEKAEKEETRTK